MVWAGAFFPGGNGMRHIEEVLKDGELLFNFLSATDGTPVRADIVLAMGSQDLGVAGTAARAFREYRARWLVCSGGFGKDTAVLFHEPEGVLYARRCESLGVPRERILVEDRASNSGENFLFSRTLLEEREIEPRTGVIACKPYMAKRAWATAAMQWPEVAWQAARTEVSFGEYLAQGNDLTAVLELMAGDLQRLRVYAGRFQAPVEVPEPVWSAFERLAEDGYDRFVIRDV